MTSTTATRVFSRGFLTSFLALVALLAALGCSDTPKVPPRDEDKMLQHQEEEMDRQGREYEDLQRQKHHDEKFRKKYGNAPVAPTE